ncbi:MAG: site-specific integrase [Blastocatellia bacterium]
MQYTDETGKHREVLRRAETRTQAKRLIQDILRELDTGGAALIDGASIGFRDYAETYRERLHEAVYVGDRKVSGLRSSSSPNAWLSILIDHFGSQKLRSITHGDIEQFKLKRLATPTHRGTQRSIASVNRELELLRAVLHQAHRDGYILKNPFQQGRALISKADEVQRDRILTAEEEERLLAACTGRRAYLRALIIVALDTAMRRGELLQLTWRNVNFDAKTITVIARTTKTLKPRLVGLTARAVEALQTLPQTRDLVFGITDSFKKAWAAACEEAGIDGLRFHDLRHTATTRIVQAGISPSIAMRLTGHTQPSTFARYVNPDNSIVTEAANILEKWRESRDNNE